MTARKGEIMSRTTWNPDSPSKVTILDAEEVQAQPLATPAPPPQQNAGQLTGGIPKGGVFHL